MKVRSGRPTYSQVGLERWKYKDRLARASILAREVVGPQDIVHELSNDSIVAGGDNM